MIPFIIWTVVALVFVIIGISCRTSKETVGFFSGVEPPKIPAENVKKYNAAVAGIWFIFAGILEVLGIPLLFFGQNSPVFIVTLLGTVFLVIGIVVAYLRIEERYK